MSECCTWNLVLSLPIIATPLPVAAIISMLYALFNKQPPLFCRPNNMSHLNPSKAHPQHVLPKVADLQHKLAILLRLT